jgi:arginyl-tRNA synthetase
LFSKRGGLEVKKTVLDRLKKHLHEHIDENFNLEKPKSIDFGHYATPLAFSLAKKLRKSPMAIADELCALVESEDIFESVQSIKGYINFKLSEEFLDSYASWVLMHEEEFGRAEHGETILLEYVSANPTGPLHIGHARGAIFGNALYHIGQHLGYKIDSEYYVNDAGNQIYLLGLSLYLSGRENILKTDVEWPQEYYRGEYINTLAQAACEEFGLSVFEEESAIDTLCAWGKEQMLTLIRSNLADVGVHFDSYVSEKALYERWDESFELLKEHNATYEQEGKIWLNSQAHGDEKDRVIVREDNRPTYLAGDIIYHHDKFKRGYDHYINIWGADHHGYIARVKSAIKHLGYDEQKLEVILSQMVALLKDGEPYKMSKRAGTFILMSDVVEDIGADALKFIFLTKKSDTHLEFDISMLDSEDSSNPIFYINYAHARVNQLFGKASRQLEDVLETKLVDLDESGKNLLFTALLLPEVLEDAFDSRAIQKLPEYLKNLAALIHKFYNEHKVVGTEHEAKYLKLLATASLSIRVGLSLIGIQAKEKM